MRHNYPIYLIGMTVMRGVARTIVVERRMIREQG
jgi:hypothetical protein